MNEEELKAKLEAIKKEREGMEITHKLSEEIKAEKAKINGMKFGGIMSRFKKAGERLGQLGEKVGEIAENYDKNSKAKGKKGVI